MESVSNNTLTRIEKIDKLVLTISSSVGFKQAEKIFLEYYELRANIQSEDKNIPLCLNRMSIIIEELSVLNVENDLMIHFHSFNAFLKQELASKWITSLPSDVHKIIYL